EHWADGSITRGVMLAVPRHRGGPCVTHERPVHGWELDDILTKRGIRLEPGDAVCVYSGREAWQAQDPEKPYGRPFGPPLQRPGSTSPACRSCATTTSACWCGTCSTTCRSAT